MNKALDRTAGTVGAKCVSMLSTGNIIHDRADLCKSGFTIVADRLMRRGISATPVSTWPVFTTMKTTAVRKLLPESWVSLPCPHAGRWTLRIVTAPRTALHSSVLHQSTRTLGKAARGVLVALGVTPAGAGGGEGDRHSSKRTCRVSRTARSLEPLQPTFWPTLPQNCAVLKSWKPAKQSQT